MKLKIRNGLVVTSSETFKADIGIEDGIITKIERKAQSASADSLPEFQADEVIDADGKYVLPGGVDVHTHLDMPFGGTVTADNFYTGTVAGACGGTTTIIDFAIQNKGETLKTVLENWHQKAKNISVVDYSFHIAITDLNEGVLSEIPRIINEGITSFKLFMAYKGSLMTASENISRVLAESSRLGFLTMLHCEDGDKIDELIKDFLFSGNTNPLYHSLSRPAELEEKAVSDALKLQEQTKGNLYIVHLSSEGALKQIRKHKGRVLTETCPQYLVLSIDKYTEKPDKQVRERNRFLCGIPDDFEGAKYVMSPPLRGKHHLNALWEGIKDNTISIVSTDHCAFNFYGQKTLGLGDFSKIPSGIPGIETRLFLLYNEGVMGKLITINKLVDVFATVPAKTFGLYPKKGEIAIGADADIVIFNQDKKLVIKSIRLHQDVDYCPFEGYRGKGGISYVISRGEIIVRDRAFSGKKGRGKFLSRRTYQVGSGV
jgi:dihydropyrimidinase